VCRGCNRYLHEVTSWNSYTDNEKKIVLNRIKQFTELTSSDDDLYTLNCAHYERYFKL